MNDSKVIAMSEEDAIKKLNALLSAASADGAKASGACVYVAGSKTYCAVLPKSSCDTLNGIWTENGKCS